MSNTGIGMRRQKKIFQIVLIFLILALSLMILFKRLVDVNLIQLPKKTLDTPLLVVGSYNLPNEDLEPMVLRIEPSNHTISKIDLKKISESNFLGIHEARSFKKDGKYMLALATYKQGSVTILSSNTPDFSSMEVEFTEVFKADERVRALYISDVDGDGGDDVVVGTRPSGILKYYKHKDGKWIGSQIDKVGSTIHDLLIIDSDDNGRNEIITTTSTTYEYRERNLSHKTPEMIKYEYLDGIWSKNVIWEPETPILNDGLYEHPRYLFTGSFSTKDSKEIVSGIVGGGYMHNLLTLKWNGTGYTTDIQNIGEGLKLSDNNIVSGDVDHDGLDEVLISALTDGGLFMFKKQNDQWKMNIIADDLVDDKNHTETVKSIATVKSQDTNDQKILYITSNDQPENDRKATFNFLVYNSISRKWDNSTIENLSVSTFAVWGVNMMSP